MIVTAPQPETPMDGVRRLFARELAQGFTVNGLHAYQDADGSILYFRVRLGHPQRDKIIRPMRLEGLRYVLGEPPRPKSGRPLYRLPDLLAADASVTVWVFEGEACADLAAQLGQVATTSGGASSAGGADWTPLRGRRVFIWPDNDGPGRKYAEDVTTRLQMLGCAVAWVDVAALGLPEHGDIVDWRQGNPDGELDALPLLDPNDGDAASAPEPLRRPIPPPEPYPLEALGPILQPAAESLRRVIQLPDAIGAASLLAAASLATQALADVHVDGRVIPLSLWMLTIGASGERKSAADKEAMRAATEYERDLARAHDAQHFAYQARLAEWEAKVAAAKFVAKKKQGAGLAEALDVIGPEPLPPLVPRVIAGDFTVEGLAKLLMAGIPSIGAFTDEAALVFGGHGMTKEAVSRTAGTLCKLWDGAAVDRVRALDGAAKLYGRRLALNLLAQPVIAEDALSDPILLGQGFLARCLLAQPDSTIGARRYRAENLRDDPAMGRVTYRLGELHRQPLPLAEGTRQELQPRALLLSAEAKAKWTHFHDAIEHALRPEGTFAHVKPWASKTPEQALRIAGALTLLESTDSDAIDADTLDRAMAIAMWHLNEAARLVGGMGVAAHVLDAEALLRWCHEKGLLYMHSSLALQKGPNRIRDAAVFDKAIAELEMRGWARRVEGGMDLDGRHRKRVWRIVRAEDD
ncbi:hypothetical protein ABIE51_002460 [Lysobacter sp. OAE881]|uniref:DUF3987 domain-containing protein n=1 Tax=Lysobacter sp. OAE881 TaxID=2663813 RepID=UPI00178A5662